MSAIMKYNKPINQVYILDTIESHIHGPAFECTFYLLRSSHEVDSSVISLIFLKQAEGKLVIDQQVVWSKVREREREKHE